jgi:glucokinase
MSTLLCADIGGTNTRLLLFRATIDSVPNTEKDLLFKKVYLNEQYASFLDVLHEFLKESNCCSMTPPVTACFAVAGPVIDNVVRFTNRMSWVVDGNQVALNLGIKKVKLINDFVANGYGLLTLDESKECIQISGGTKVKSAPVACLGAGTGLGECFLTSLEMKDDTIPRGIRKAANRLRLVEN